MIPLYRCIGAFSVSVEFISKEPSWLKTVEVSIAISLPSRFLRRRATPAKMATRMSARWHMTVYRDLSLLWGRVRGFLNRVRTCLTCRWCIEDIKMSDGPCRVRHLSLRRGQWGVYDKSDQIPAHCCRHMSIRLQLHPQHPSSRPASKAPCPTVGTLTWMYLVGYFNYQGNHSKKHHIPLINNYNQFNVLKRY